MMAEIDATVHNFLRDPATFSQSEPVEVVKTHGAVVYLGAREGLKIKRPVAYSYMDFSTLEKRQKTCLREFEINRRTAPQLYLGLRAITKEADGSLALDGSGETIEWAVHMKRFNGADILSSKAATGKLDSALAIQLGEQIAAYHRTLSPTDRINNADAMRSVVNQISGPLKNEGDETQSFRAACSLEIDHLADKLTERTRLGFVRRCHGDLHLGNIVLLNGVPTPFDALEFDENLATIDVLYDLAFLLMDIRHAGLAKEANICLNHYALNHWEAICHDGLRLLPLYLALRAGIRAMVDVQTAAIGGEDAADKRADARQYIHDGLKMLAGEKPHLIAVSGLSGSGKSTLARTLAPCIGRVPGALLLRSDVERKYLAGVSETDKLPTSAYTQEATQKVYARLLEKAEIVLAQGYSVILDAVFSDPNDRAAPITLAHRLDVPFIGLKLKAPLDILIQRVNARKYDASDADDTIVRAQFTHFQDWADEADWHGVDASRSPEETEKAAKSVLEI